jgi:hypothetical protein
VQVGALQYVTEVVHGHSVHEVGLIFGARPLAPLGPDTLVIDPHAPDTDVLPPILSRIAEDGPEGPAAPCWLGNIWVPRS